MTPQEARDGVTELRGMLGAVMRSLSVPDPSLEEAGELLARALRRGSKLWFYLKVGGEKDGEVGDS